MLKIRALLTGQLLSANRVGSLLKLLLLLLLLPNQICRMFCSSILQALLLVLRKDRLMSCQLLLIELLLLLVLHLLLLLAPLLLLPMRILVCLLQETD
jgi:hypothetical protein